MEVLDDEDDRPAAAAGEAIRCNASKVRALIASGLRSAARLLPFFDPEQVEEVRRQLVRVEPDP